MERFTTLKYLHFCLLILVSLCLGGCGSTPSATSYTNPISGRRTDILGPTLLDTKDQSREMLWINAYRDFQNKMEFKYYLEVIYGANQETGYLDIGPGRNLTIIADGEELRFIGLGSLERKKEDNAIYEIARYDATASDMSAIANAQKVTVKVTGKSAIVIRDFTEETFKNFRDFVNITSGEPAR